MLVGSARRFTTIVFSVTVTEIIVIVIMIMMASQQAMVLQTHRTWMSALLLRSSAGRAWKAVQDRLSCQATWQRMQNLWLQLWQALLTSVHRAGTLHLRGAKICSNATCIVAVQVGMTD